MDAIAAILDDAIATGVCSAAAAAVGGGHGAATWTRGHLRVDPGGAPIDATTRFDLASLTKPMATATVALSLIGDGALRLTDRAARWLPGLGDDVAIVHLLGHASGLPAHVKFYERLWAGERAGAADARAALIAMALATPRVAAAGQAAIYSDVGYILLAALCERRADRPFEELVAAALAPLALAATGFVDLRAPGPRPLAPVTELCPVRGWVAGEVHDENAHAGGGVAGHAGLFAPIGDVARFAQAMAAAPRVGFGPIAPALAAHALSTAAAPDTTWRLGWDTPSATPGVSHAGERWPRHASAGHLGFTGTSLWLDLARGEYAVLLTNRVHPRRDRPEAARIKDVRRTFGDAAQAWLAHARA